MPTACDAWPGKMRASNACDLFRLLLGLRVEMQHVDAVVSAAIWTHHVRHFALFTLRTVHHRRELDVIVAAALAAPR